MKISNFEQTKRPIRTKKSAFLAMFIAAASVFLSVCAPAQADDFATRIQLFVELIPEEHKLEATAAIRAFAGDADRVRLLLSKDATIRKFLIDGKKRPYKFSKGVLATPVEKTNNGFANVEISYEAVYDDPVPVLPVNTDNPGYGVTGTIAPTGTFLLSGSGWHPQTTNGKSSYDLTVKAPAGVIAVTAGKYLGAETDGPYTVSRWKIENAPEGLALSAAEYQVSTKRTGNVDAMTFLLRENARLAPTYLDATAKYILDYEAMFGPYAFEKFAVVENFFPTGYGFPSYTLLGTTVLRLPFIVYTSLGHEIAHCWWGNGVLPEYSKGNWSEGLATYVADYLFKERQSPAEAREYRLQLLRNYSTLTAPSDDFPLSQFASRVDPATKVVGYDKGAMFFHMLRKKTGDEIFWEGLRRMYARFLFREASWEDFENTYESLLNEPLDGFFDQWIERPGAPILSVEDVAATKSGPVTTVKGRLVQQPPFYNLNVHLLLKTQESKLEKTVAIDGRSASFEFKTKETPVKLSADPEVDIFRRLYPSEIPPSINSLKASDNLVIAMAGENRKKYEPIGTLFAQAFGAEDFKIVDAESLEDKKLPDADILWIGPPPETVLKNPAADGAVSLGAVSLGAVSLGAVSLQNDRFFLNDAVYDRPGDAFFGVFPNPDSKNRVTAVFLPLSPEQTESVARKIPHYGKYSYLAFRQGRNADKGTWPAKDSPLIHRFAEEKPPNKKNG